LSVEIENGGSFVKVVWFLEKDEFLAIAASKPAFWIFLIIFVSL